jgi:hypothetical protein
MKTPELADRAHQMESLVAEGRYGEAQGVFEDYCGVLEKILRGLPPGDPAVRQLEDEWHRLLDATRQRVLVGRAHTAMRLASLCSSRQFYGEPPQARGTWQCQA